MAAGAATLELGLGESILPVNEGAYRLRRLATGEVFDKLHCLYERKHISLVTVPPAKAWGL